MKINFKLRLKNKTTLLLAIVFAVLALTNRVSPEQFLTVFTVVISFYYGTQAGKNRKDDDK